MQISTGIKYMFIATFFFSLMNIGVKYLPGIPPIEIVFFRSLVSLVLSFSFIRLKRINPWGNNKLVLVGRGLVGAAALILYFTTLQAMPLASAAIIQFLAPIFTAILGIFIIKENVGKWQWLFFLTSFAGVVVLHGTDTRITPFHLGIGILAAVFTGLAYNFVRKLSKTENPLVIVFYFPLVTIPITGIYVVTHWIRPTIIELVILLLVGISTQIGQIFMTKAFQHDTLAKVVSLRYLGIIYALIYGHVLFGESFSLLSYLGMGLVLVGVFLNLKYKQMTSK